MALRITELTDYPDPLPADTDIPVVIGGATYRHDLNVDFDVIDASIALKAALASPTFTGTPSLPTGTTGVTQTAGDSSTKLATTAYVMTAVTTLSVAPPVGAVYFQGPNDTAPGTLYTGTTWADVSWEEANMTRRVVGSLSGARFTGVPARLTVTVSSGVPSIAITSGGSGYLSGGSGSLTLTIAGTCTTQMAATATVASGVITAIVVGTAGVGYTSGAVAVYDGVAGHNDIVQRHWHQLIAGTPTGNVGITAANYINGVPYSGYYPGNTNTGITNTVIVENPITDNANGTPRVGAETSGAWATVTKWRRTA